MLLNNGSIVGVKWDPKGQRGKYVTCITYQNKVTATQLI